MIIKKNINKKKNDNSELKKIYTDIILHFSDFWSKHSENETAIENSKVLVFNSEISFKEIVKVFINEVAFWLMIKKSNIL